MGRELAGGWEKVMGAAIGALFCLLTALMDRGVGSYLSGYAMSRASRVLLGCARCSTSSPTAIQAPGSQQGAVAVAIAVAAVSIGAP